MQQVRYIQITCTATVISNGWKLVNRKVLIPWRPFWCTLLQNRSVTTQRFFVTLVPKGWDVGRGFYPILLGNVNPVDAIKTWYGEGASLTWLWFSRPTRVDWWTQNSKASAMSDSVPIHTPFRTFCPLQISAFYGRADKSHIIMLQFYFIVYFKELTEVLYELYGGRGFRASGLHSTLHIYPYPHS
jgi:hypothetical protein